MTDVVSIRFKETGKVYYFDPQGTQIPQGEKVIVETAKGLEIAECVAGNHEVPDSVIRQPFRPVVRVATPQDRLREEENHRREAEAFEICQKKIAAHGLDMKLVEVECSFEGNKILFFFTSEGRVDFRELVKDLASTFRTRIELRQIGVRDEARMLGGLGICGRPFCCSQFMEDFQPVSIKMAKTQGLSLNPTKISGTCGRLMCCLKYEQDAYEELVHNVPKVDAFVDTPSGKGSVVDVNLLKSTVRVRLEDQSDNPVRTFEAADVTVLGGKAKRAEYLAAKAESKPQETQGAQQPRLRRTLESRTASEGTKAAQAEPRETGASNRNRRPKQRERTEPRAASRPQTAAPEGAKTQTAPETAKPQAGQNGQSGQSGKDRRQGNYHKRYRPRNGKRPREEGTSNPDE